jgi:multiple sugar transport system permease protein
VTGDAQQTLVGQSQAAPPAAGVTAWLASRRTRRVIGLVLGLAALVVVGIFFAGPFYWMFITAVKPRDQLLTLPLIWWPREFLWQNFVDVWVKEPFTRYLINTIIITAASVAGHTLSAALVGYGFAVGKFRGRNFWFVVLLATMMIPPQVTLIPLFVIFRFLGWLNTFLPLIVPTFFGVGGAFYIFLMRQFFLSVPIELEEAARIDGAGTLRIWWNIYLPLSVPALATVAVFSFVGAWNDFFGPLIYLPRKENWTLTLGLAALTDPNFVDFRQQMAAGFLIMLPCVLVFFLAQRLFTEGIASSGLKG